MSIIKALIKLILGRGVYRSYSVSGEDLIILPFLPAKGGFYVDVGCYHPILYSNTYRLYRNGWKGIVIDPNRRLGRLFPHLPSVGHFYPSGNRSGGDRERTSNSRMSRITLLILRALRNIN